MKRGHLATFIFILVLGFYSSTAWATADCASLLSGIREAQPSDWAHSDRSLGAVALNSVLWLSGAESMMLLKDGHDSFGAAFLANTSIDVVLTIISHQISLGNVPAKFKKYFEGKQSYRKRAKVNTTMAMMVLLPIWTAAAAASGADVTSLQSWVAGEVIHPLGPLGALALFYSAYRFAPYWKNHLFQTMPQNEDARAWSALQESFPAEMKEIKEAARARAQELNLEESSFEHLVMSMVEVVRLRMNYEDRISGSLANENKIARLVRKMEQAPNENQRINLRKKLIRELIRLHDQGHYQQDILDVLSLGTPFSAADSLELHRQLNQRNWKKRFRLAVTAFIDQGLWVGFLGGVVLRGLTGFSLAP